MQEWLKQQLNGRHSNPVTAEDRAARLGQNLLVIGVSAQLIEQAQALESLLIQQGVVAVQKLV